jgi:uncharacterized protein YecT (DUF1311 family)
MISRGGLKMLYANRVLRSSDSSVHDVAVASSISSLHLLAIQQAMHIRIAVLVLLVTGLLAYPARAQSQSDCSSATTTASMRTCAIARYETAQRDLDKTIDQLEKDLDTIGNQRLKDAQAAWVKFRDANADFIADSARGGTLAPVLRESALADMTEARSNELKKVLRP